MRMLLVTASVLALASAPALAAPDPTTTWPEAVLKEGERLSGSVPKPGTTGVMDQPAQHWISPSGHAVTIAPVWTKEKVVIRAYWNDPKPRTQDVAEIPGPVVYTSNPFYTDHADGQLALSVTGNIGGPDKGYAFRLAFDPKRGFKVLKKATYVYALGNNQSPKWLQGDFEISNSSRAHSLGQGMRMRARPFYDMSRAVKVVTRTAGSKDAPAEETTTGGSLVKKWDTAGQWAAAGFKTKCNAKDNCCTYDTKSLSAWLALEKVCFVDNKPGTVFLVAPKQ